MPPRNSGARKLLNDRRQSLTRMALTLAKSEWMLGITGEAGASYGVQPRATF
jgi:hypothetical protein